jgi:hypothetical protein
LGFLQGIPESYLLHARCRKGWHSCCEIHLLKDMGVEVVNKTFNKEENPAEKAAVPSFIGRYKGETEPEVKKPMSKSGQTKKKGWEIPLKERSNGSSPMKVVVDGKGNPWICDCDADPSKDLAGQGCWQFREESSNQSNERRSRQKRRRIS